MRRFRFRLDPVLRLRSQLERVARKDLALAIAEVHGFDQKLAAAARGLRDCADQAARSDSVGQLARALESGLRRHHQRVVRQRKSADDKLAQERILYNKKSRELHTLERLHEQQHHAWRTETQRLEQAELDELAMLSRGNESPFQDSESSHDGESAWQA